MQRQQAGGGAAQGRSRLASDWGRRWKEEAQTKLLRGSESKWWVNRGRVGGYPHMMTMCDWSMLVPSFFVCGLRCMFVFLLCIRCVFHAAHRIIVIIIVIIIITPPPPWSSSSL